MDFKDKIKATGHVEIIKINHLTNVSSVVYEDPNVITGGLGRSIAQFMSTSGCIIDLCPTESQQFGPRNSIIQPGGGEENSLKGENRGGATPPAKSSGQEEEEWCCLGNLFVEAKNFTLSQGSTPRMMKWEVAVSVTTTVVCDDSLLCEGSRWFSTGDCDSAVDDFNKKLGSLDDDGGGFMSWAPGTTKAGPWGAILQIQRQKLYKLGCCSGTAGLTNTTLKVHTNISGEVAHAGAPGGRPGNEPLDESVVRDVATQLRMMFDVGGTTPPTFAECCGDCGGDGS